MTPTSATDVLDAVRIVADRFAADRHDRQRRRELDPADFEALADAGVRLTAVPVEAGGLFESVPRSTRAIAEILRTLARGDASVALVTAMHPSVLSFWLATADVPEPHTQAFAEQRAHLGQLAAEAWFGTITSEPGSGGDVGQTQAAATPDAAAGGGWRVSGQKHFGSGSGITSYMLTSARPAGEEEPDWFYLDMRGVPWDGSQGATLTAPWDGHGMIATQSHGFRFEDFPATRIAWPGHWREIAEASGPCVATLFTAVIAGVVETAMATAAEQLGRRRDALRPYEQVEWANAEQRAWLMRQAYEGMLRAVEHDPAPLRTVTLGKTACADLAEDCLRSLTRVMGGGSFARHSPFGFWFEDVRALGFLRPPWGVAYDNLIGSAWDGDGTYRPA